MARKAGKLVGIGGKKEEHNTPTETASKHHDMLVKLIPQIEEDEPGPIVTDQEWLAGKRKKALRLQNEVQPKLEKGVNVTITLSASSIPRQLSYDLEIAPNTTTVAGVSTPPTLTAGELYTFYVGFNGKPSMMTAKFFEVMKYGGQWMLKVIPPGERETERKDTGKRLTGKYKGIIVIPALQPDGSPNYRLANAASTEPPVFRMRSSRNSVRGGLQPIEVEAEPLALTSRYAKPKEDPPGLERIAAPLRRSGRWVAGHMVNGTMGGPGTKENLIPIDDGTNSKMRGNYENALRQNLRLGKYYHFHAHADYFAGTQKGIGQASDFVKSVSIAYEEIAKNGSGWVRTGVTGSAGPYPLVMPTVGELDPSRVSG